MDREEGLLPSGKIALSSLGIDPVRLRWREIPREQRAHYRAITNWLTKYDDRQATSNKEKLRGVLESFYHCCALEDWRGAIYLLHMPLNTPTHEDVHNQLFTWFVC